MTEVSETSARQGLLRSALDSEWSVLWQTGQLGVAQSDDLDEIIRKIELYLRGQRNPLLDRRDFHLRD